MQAIEDMQDRMLMNEAWKGCDAVFIINGKAIHLSDAGARIEETELYRF